MAAVIQATSSAGVPVVTSLDSSSGVANQGIGLVVSGEQWIFTMTTAAFSYGPQGVGQGLKIFKITTDANLLSTVTDTKDLTGTIGPGVLFDAIVHDGNVYIALILDSEAADPALVHVFQLPLTLDSATEEAELNPPPPLAGGLGPFDAKLAAFFEDDSDLNIMVDCQTTATANTSQGSTGYIRNAGAWDTFITGFPEQGSLNSIGSYMIPRVRPPVVEGLGAVLAGSFAGNSGECVGGVGYCVTVSNGVATLAGTASDWGTCFFAIGFIYCPISGGIVIGDTAYVIAQGDGSFGSANCILWSAPTSDLSTWTLVEDLTDTLGCVFSGPGDPNPVAGMSYAVMFQTDGTDLYAFLYNTDDAAFAIMKRDMATDTWSAVASGIADPHRDFYLSV